ncbi:hypothetical protein GOP47_0026028 [Adiantum capillus-veneris]|uniref:arogenate dehydratase n=1 Tax=Adiantum capillus-veneris TaxID=13818 RepID=A0A9D4Z3E8_ADICA|nr:hypothetical protein GOP47_0026028 [Adiantum capillus-veneris]
MEVTKLRQGALSNTAPAAPAPGQHRRPHVELQSLPIARDSHGRSPLQYSNAGFSFQSPKSMVATPKPSSPAALLVESLAPSAAKSKNWASLQEKKPMAPHNLGRCLLEVSGNSISAALKMVAWGEVACEGSPTVRALSQAFPESNPAMYSQPEAALSALEGRQVQRALLPVESSTRGSVHRTYDLLLRHKNVHIVGELLQVQQRLHRPAETEDEETECGRFWVLSRDASVLPPLDMSGTEKEQKTVSFKSTVAMVLREGLGALHKALAAFAFRGIEVSKVESRPWRPQPLATAPASCQTSTTSGHLYFQYVLFIDIESSTASRATQNALAQLQEHASFLRLLGSYPCFHTSSLQQYVSTPVAHQPALTNHLPVLQVGAAP